MLTKGFSEPSSSFSELYRLVQSLEIEIQVLDESQVVDRRWAGRDEFFEVSWSVPRAKCILKAEVKSILADHYRFGFLVNLLVYGWES
jgi:hypothetical protein